MCGTKCPFNCFTYNNRIFHNQTNSSNAFTIRDEKCDYFNLIKKIFGVCGYSKTKKNGMGEIHHTPPKSHFMAKNRFWVGSCEPSLLTSLIFIRYSNLPYSYVLIWFIYSHSVQYSTVQNSIRQKVKKFLESTLCVKNVCSTSSVCMIHHLFLVSTTSSNQQAWHQWLLFPGGIVHLVRHSSCPDFPERN